MVGLKAPTNVYVGNRTVRNETDNTHKQQLTDGRECKHNTITAGTLARSLHALSPLPVKKLTQFTMSTLIYSTHIHTRTDTHRRKHARARAHTHTHTHTHTQTNTHTDEHTHTHRLIIIDTHFSTCFQSLKPPQRLILVSTYLAKNAANVHIANLQRRPHRLLVRRRYAANTSLHDVTLQIVFSTS